MLVLTILSAYHERVFDGKAIRVTRLTHVELNDYPGKDAMVARLVLSKVMSSTTRPAYRSDIDGLRAIAVALVVGYHAFPRLVFGGFIGVDVFFVISGYLISGIILADLGKSGFYLKEFYVRRCRRIVPALLVVLLATWIIGWITLLGAEYESLARHLIAAATFTSNIVLWNEAGYFDGPAELKPLLHLWSLGVEEQFYIVWPLLMVALFRWRNSFLAGAIALSLASFLLNIHLVRLDPSTSFYLLPSRMWELLAGASLAYLHFRGGHRAAPFTGAPVIRALVGWSALFTIVVSAFLISGANPYPGWYALAPVLASFALIAVGRGGWAGMAVLSNRPAVLVGLISYPLYLWHWPLLCVFAILNHDMNLPAGQARSVKVVLVLVSIALAYATWRWIEKPLQRVTTRHAVTRDGKSSVLKVYAAAIAGLAAIGILTLVAHGVPSRHLTVASSDIARLREDASLAVFLRFREDFPRCRGAWIEAVGVGRCYQANLREVRVAVYGDSHAQSLFPGLALALGGVNTALISRIGCDAFAEAAIQQMENIENCVAFNRAALRVITTAPSVKTVILGDRGPLYVSGRSLRGGREQTWDIRYPVPQDAEGFRENYKAAVHRTLRALEKAGKRVVYVLDVPELGFSPQQCIDARPHSPASLRHPCAVSRQVVEKMQSDYRQVIAELKAMHPRLIVFDPMNALCDELYCYALRHDRIYYADDQHLGRYGSEVVGRRLAEHLALKGLLP